MGVVSSLELQISLYFHVRFSVVHVLFFVIAHSQSTTNENNSISNLKFQAISAAIWCVIESSRIYLGYAGNLCEQVPHLFGFLFLSVFPQTILIVLIIALQWNHGGNALSFVMNLIQLLFIFSQLLFGFVAVKNVIYAQTEKFKMKTKIRRQQLGPDLKSN